jgi:segregation and condensation protein B
MPERIMDDAAADEVVTSPAAAVPAETPPIDVDDAAGATQAEAAEPSIEIEVAADPARLGSGRGGRRRREIAADQAAADADDEPAAARGDEDAAESEPADGPAGSAREEVCRHQALSARVEALLLASDRPMTESRLAEICGLPRAGAVARIREALAELSEFHRASGRSFRPRKVAGGWQLVTLPAFGPLMARLHRDRQETRLSPAAMETLSIIAYRQPVLRAELEAIRGVACGEVLRSLMERRLVSIVGRSEELGRPMLYGTTRQFLEVFGLSSLEDLPEVAGLERRRTPRPVAAASPVDELEDPAEVEPDSDPSASPDAVRGGGPDAEDAADVADVPGMMSPEVSPEQTPA